MGRPYLASWLRKNTLQFTHICLTAALAILLLQRSPTLGGMMDAPSEVSRYQNDILKSKLGFDHVYVITMKKTPDREEIMRRRLDYMNVDYEIVYATNALDPIVGAYKRAFVDPPLPADTPGDGAWSLVYTTSRIVQDAVLRGYSSFLILEDDADLESNTTAIVQEAMPYMGDDWDTVFLGHCRGRETQGEESGYPNLRRSRQPWCNHAYAISAKGALKLMKYLLKPVNRCPLDQRLLVQIIQRKEIVSWSFDPPLSIQVRLHDSQIRLGEKPRPVRGQTLVDSVWSKVNQNFRIEGPGGWGFIPQS